MIYELENPLIVPKIIKMAECVPGTPIDKLQALLLNSIGKPDSKIYIDSRDGEIMGFIFASIENFEGKNCVFIQFCVVNSGGLDHYIVFELLTKIKLWAKENNLNEIYFSTKRDPKGFIRMFHFEFYSSILKIDLKKEKEEFNRKHKQSIERMHYVKPI